MTKTRNKSQPGNEESRNSVGPKDSVSDFLPNLDTSKIKFQVLKTPIKSESDKKEYKVIRLENGLTACLVSDKAPLVYTSDDETDDEEGDTEGETETESEGSVMETDEETDSDIERGVQKSPPEQKMAAAALCVGVGSFSDLGTIQGMAHFLEHMVFMGSTKFPQENDFDSFLSKRGGSDNASTDCEVTTFYFECLEKHFYTALDKWAQFFISPLLKREAMTREREAIESEFQMALPSDSYKKEQLIASLAKSDSPVNNFTWGNLITLRDNVADDVLHQTVHEFRKRHYSAHRMTLAVQARLPMEMLESFVLNCFSTVPCNDLPADDFKHFTHVFDTPEFTKLYVVDPTNNVTQLDVTWVLPSLLGKYKSKPHQYVSWLLGDEGKGSLLSFLRKKVWVLSMTTGNGESGSEHNSLYALFTVSMVLTDTGLKHLNEIIEAMFSYIHMLKKVGPQERIFNEIKKIEDTSFRFAAEESAVEFVEELAENMQLYPPEDYITGSELFFEYDPDAIMSVLNSLTPRKMNIMLMCKSHPDNYQFDKTEKWFGTKYTDRNIPEEWIVKWENVEPLEEFSIPPPNQYLSEHFEIVAVDEAHPDYPEKIVDNELVEVWFRKDQKFQLPVAYYYFYLINADALKSARSVSLMEFYVNLLLMQMIEDSYPAQVAELSYTIKTGDKGVILKISGYNEKLHLLVELITRHLVSFNSNLSEDVFDAVKDKLMKFYHNTLIKPSSLAKDVRLGMLLDVYPATIDKYNGLFSVTFNEMKSFVTSFNSQLYTKILIQGNVTKDNALNISNEFVSTINYQKLTPKTYPIYHVVEVPKGQTTCLVQSFNKNDANSIITNYYQAGTFSIRDSVIIEILMLIIEEPLFDTLRTKEQLGYHVSCSMRDTYGVVGFTISVNSQATKCTTEFVDARIEQFIKQASEILLSMSDESFSEIKKDLIKVKQCSDVHLKEEVHRNWEEIAEDDYIFDRFKQEISAIEEVKLTDVKNWWHNHSSASDKGNFRKLSVHIVGFNTNENDSADAQHFAEFKEMKLNYLKCDNNEDKSDKSKVFVQDIDAFKKDLKLFPAYSKPPVKLS